MSVSHKERTAGQVERISRVFNEHPGGVSRQRLSEEAFVPETSIPSLLARMRASALNLEHLPAVLKIGGVWVYGWAGSLRAHNEEHYKRRKNEHKSLRLSIAMLKQSVLEHPNASEVQDQLRAAQHRLEDVEAQIARLAEVLSLLRQEAA